MSDSETEELFKDASDFYDIPEAEPEACPHLHTCKTDSGRLVCLDCSLEIQEEINHEQEWRYYKENDNKNTSDPSRCQIKRIVDKGIRKDLEKLDFCTDIIDLADEYYNEVTKGEIKRSKLRKGLMFACVFEACKKLKLPKTPDELCKIFNINRRNMSKGLTSFKLGKTKEYDTEPTHITAEHYIPKVLEQFQVRDEHVKKILDLYDQLKHKSRIINTSNPQSVSSGLVYYYFRKNNIELSEAKFGKIVELSEITISRIANEIDDFFNSQ